MGYLMTLLAALIITNIMLYFYGVDIPISDWFACTGDNTDCLGAQTQGDSPSATEPTGVSQGGLGSPSLIYQLIIVIVGAITLTAGISVGLSVIASDFSITFTIPLVMFMAIFLTLIITPMGSLLISQADATTGLYCYSMRDTAVSFATITPTPVKACLPFEAHLLMIAFFSLLTIGAFMTFVAGRDF